MRITAIICLRNEQEYIANCLDHLVANGVTFAIIDNESSDQTVDIVHDPKYRGSLVHFSSLPYSGVFELETQLRCKQRVIEEVTSDWIIHLDADEIVHSYREEESLLDAVQRVAYDGFNAINLNEFVFLPINSHYRANSQTQAIDTYYFFEPHPIRLMRIWHRKSNLTNLRGGGHLLDGKVQMAPETFALRHYIFRDQDHANQKYTGRIFSDTELQKGWHGNRIGRAVESFRFPPQHKLQILSHPESRNLLRADLKRSHYWEWDN